MSGKHVAKKNKHAGKRRFPLALMALVLVAVMAVGGTAAYLITGTAQVENKFTPAGVPISINEKLDGTTKTSVTVKNDGTAKAYIRVAIVANAVDADGNVVAGTAPSYTINSTWWEAESDGYYYYKGVVEPGAKTAELFTGDVSFAGGEVNILAESIQAEGAYNGTDPEVYAWGVNYNGSSWSAVGTN